MEYYTRRKHGKGREKKKKKKITSRPVIHRFALLVYSPQEPLCADFLCLALMKRRDELRVRCCGSVIAVGPMVFVKFERDGGKRLPVL